jgi:dTDP-4-amino-4,6-dideoxygalactose transaminase
MIKFLDLKLQYEMLRPDIDDAIASVINNAAFIGGPEIKAFEEEFAAYQQAKHCIGVGNGTDALEIIIEALGFAPGSEIIVPANSFIASSEAVSRSGCRVVFADVDPNTYTLDPADVARRITSKTVGLMVVHLYGQPAKLDELLALAELHSLKIIEDCAQSHGAEFRGKRVGAIGAAGSFSFYPGKNLGAYGDAGAIVTNDDALAVRCRMIANHGRVEKYNHQFEGRNSRLDSLQAAVLRVKLARLDSWIERRNSIAQAYIDGLSDISDLTLPVILPEVRHAFHLFVVRSRYRDQLKAHLIEHGVETGIHYPIALPKLQAYAHQGQASEDMFACQSDMNLLSLPMGEHLTDQEIALVISAVKSFPPFCP